MAASLLTRCAAKSTRSVFANVTRNGASLFCTKPTDGDQETSRISGFEKNESTVEPKAGERALAGFARVLEKAREVEVSEENAADDMANAETEHTTFAAMVRHSKLMQMGDVAGRTVVGIVIEVVGDDLYIDFGGKFHCVCPRPRLNSHRYHRGAKVKLQLNDFEMSSSFLGSETHVTLMEADATLLGLRRQPPSLSSW